MSKLSQFNAIPSPGPNVYDSAGTTLDDQQPGYPRPLHPTIIVQCADGNGVANRAVVKRGSFAEMQLAFRRVFKFSNQEIKFARYLCRLADRPDMWMIMDLEAWDDIVQKEDLWEIGIIGLATSVHAQYTSPLPLEA